MGEVFPQGLGDELPEERLQQGLQSAMALLYGKSAVHADVDAWLSDPSRGVPLEEATEAVIARDVKIAATVKGYAEGRAARARQPRAARVARPKPMALPPPVRVTASQQASQPAVDVWAPDEVTSSSNLLRDFAVLGRS